MTTSADLLFNRGSNDFQIVVFSNKQLSCEDLTSTQSKHILSFSFNTKKAAVQKLTELAKQPKKTLIYYSRDENEWKKSKEVPTERTIKKKTLVNMFAKRGASVIKNTTIDNPNTVNVNNSGAGNLEAEVNAQTITNSTTSVTQSSSGIGLGHGNGNVKIENLTKYYAPK